jgi:hypothetical protein
MNILLQVYLWAMALFGIQSPPDGCDVFQTGERQTMSATDDGRKSKKDRNKDRRPTRTGQIYNGF